MISQERNAQLPANLINNLDGDQGILVAVYF